MDKKISSISNSLVRQFGSRDPFAIADGLGFTVTFREDFKHQRGAFAIILRNVFIFINSNLCDEMQRMVCAHELGHALLHRGIAAKSPWILEHELFDMRNKAEYEANLFAASLLIDKDELYSLLKNGMDVIQAASCMKVNVNLILMYITMERDIPSGSRRLPFLPDAAFLKD